MKLVFVGSLLLLVTSQVSATCPEKDAMPNFDASRFLGLWHNVREPEANYPGWEVIKCTHSLLEEGDNGAFSSLYMYLNETDGNYRTTNGTLRRASPDGTDGKLQGEFGAQRWLAKYYVLGTDYDNYAVVWLCRPKPNNEEGNIELSVLMSRQRTLDQAHIDEANDYLPDGTYHETNQSDCPEHDHGHAGHGHAHHHH